MRWVDGCALGACDRKEVPLALGSSCFCSQAAVVHYSCTVRAGFHPLPKCGSKQVLLWQHEFQDKVSTGLTCEQTICTKVQAYVYK